jgi:hypothetical protein
MQPKEGLKSIDKAAQLFDKWNGNKENAIKDVESTIDHESEMKPFNPDEPPVHVKWLYDVIEEIKKL